ncbi:MAG TPA: peptidoglycan DD-metalloendopeptidase family protein [Spirochaetota bacterium]|nr:peptidoglycan DD-metalloendopeptidase family protein [Spirochaetota bacterium]
MVVTSHEYLPFGEDWITEGDTKNAPKYNSQELDKESGYYFYNARHYDPEIARFVTPDTVVPRENDTQSWNRFAYCRNNPIIYRDPTGHAEREGIFGLADKIGEKISNVGEGIKSTGEKLTQPLRNAGEWLKDKLQGNKGSENNRTGKSNNTVLKPSLVDGYEVPIEQKYSPRVSSEYGPRSYDNRFHPGADAIPQKNKDGTWMSREQRRGLPIINLGDGKVVFAGETDGGGKTVVVDHGKGIKSTYMHLDKINVREEQSLKKGEQVGGLGWTGRLKGTGPHIHWEISKDGKTIDPKGTTVEKEVNK